MNIFYFNQKDAEGTGSGEAAGNTVPSFKRDSEETAFANQQLNRLLERYKEIMSAESHDKRMHLVKKWSAAYPPVALDPEAATYPVRNSAGGLKERPRERQREDRSRLAADEIHRFENEGGPPLKTKQGMALEQPEQSAPQPVQFASHLHDNDKLH